ncbi:hypothetical protein FQV07_0007890, partial [Pygoscelis papua]
AICDSFASAPFLVTGANWGIGLGLVWQVLGMPNPPEWVFAARRDPMGERAQELQNLACRHPHLVIIPLEVTDPASIKTAAARVREQLGGSGLNLLINNAGMLIYNTLDNETLHLPSTAIPALSHLRGTCWDGPSAGRLHGDSAGAPCAPERWLHLPSPAPATGSARVPLQPPFPSHRHPCPVSPQAALNMPSKCQSLGYREHGVLCAALHPGWVQTDMGGFGSQKPPVMVDESVRGMLKVLSSLSEKATRTFLDWEGKVVPW